MEKGEFQGGIAPYGYKKDSQKKNHLIIDEYAAEIVKNIFDMYVNKGMSTIKIADKLNQREILAPAVYLDIPTFRNKKSKNPKGKYIWLRNQINNILRNEVYIGNVVGGKYKKVSHKIAKVEKTKKEEYVVVENMHEPIIDIYTWNNAQERLNERNAPRERKYDHPLKGLIFCKECGAIATLRCRTEQRKTGKIWRADYFICTNRNSYRALCECKQIQARIIEDEIKRVLTNEIQKIKFSDKELNIIYNDAQIVLKKEKYKLEKSLEDYKRIYEKKKEEKNDVIRKIKILEDEINQIMEKTNNVDMIRIKKKASEILELNNITKQIYQKLIARIEFDKEKNIIIKFKFAKHF